MKPIKHLTKGEVIEFLKNVDKKTWGAVVAGVVIVAALWIFFMAPAWLQRPKLHREMQSMDSQMRQFHALAPKRAVWEENEKIFSGVIQDAKLKVYKESEGALLLGQVSKLAKEAGVEIVASKPRSEKVVSPGPFQDKLQTFDYDFTIQGGYHEVGKFAAEVESNYKLLRIQAIQIVAEQNNPEKQVAQFWIAAVAERTVPLPKKITGGAKSASPAKKN